MIESGMRPELSARRVLQTYNGPTTGTIKFSSLYAGFVYHIKEIKSMDKWTAPVG